MKIALVGGGTGGTITPLLAVAEVFRKRYPDAVLFFIGTNSQPERMLVERAGIKFYSVPAGKLRRYFSLSNLIDPFKVIAGFFKSYGLLRAQKPDAILSVGSYVSVSVIWAGRMLGIPALVHQQDVVPGLANKLVASVAKKISVTFESSLRDFPRSKTTWIGNPIRTELLMGDRAQAAKIFNLKPEPPIVLVFGGGTGAAPINELIAGAGFRLVEICQLIHIFGPQKMLIKLKHENYHTYEFLAEDMKHAYAAADVVVCRAGLSSITEAAALGKPTVFIPMPHTHQEANADLLKRYNAAVVLDQQSIDSEFLVNVIQGLLANPGWREVLSKNIRQLAKPDAGERLTDLLVSLTAKS
ncbi:MAG: undecaprenyldiphospho-muramoylpentapeptide beta-N-acetylglucosaminyltransferase [Patescibacteria group bacterium]|jgi:UDP-N-acetylglucosamine--N-acetylmuramyl-(pentapeptide) pyrophosphoryl-undecaprenol N-acetylglucosamine transferase